MNKFRSSKSQNIDFCFLIFFIWPERKSDFFPSFKFVLCYEAHFGRFAWGDSWRLSLRRFTFSPLIHREIKMTEDSLTNMSNLIEEYMQNMTQTGEEQLQILEVGMFSVEFVGLFNLL